MDSEDEILTSRHDRALERTAPTKQPSNDESLTPLERHNARTRRIRGLAQKIYKPSPEATAILGLTFAASWFLSASLLPSLLADKLPALAKLFASYGLLALVAGFVISLATTTVVANFLIVIDEKWSKRI